MIGAHCNDFRFPRIEWLLKMQLHDLSIDDAKLQRFCEEHRIRRLSFFGSVIRDDFGSESDIDVIVDLFPPDTSSLLDLATMQAELTELFGRQVHLHTLDMLHPYLRDRILQRAQVAYAA